MNTTQFIVLALVVGLPSAFIQLLLSWREKKRQRKSALWQAWSALQTELAETLHHPHPEARELDLLLEKLQTFTVTGLETISDSDRSRLVELLREKVDNSDESSEERIRAEFLLFAMPRAKREQMNAEQ